LVLFREAAKTDAPYGAFFYLGQAYYLDGNKADAELYFRQYLDAVKKTHGFTDLEVLDVLSNIYLDEHSYSKAVEVLQQAVEHYDKADRDLKLKYPKAMMGLKYAKALYELGNWQLCITECEKLIGPKEAGTEAQMLLVRAFIQNKQP